MSRMSLNILRKFLQGTRPNYRHLSSKTEINAGESIKFSTSKAAKGKPLIRHTLSENMPWYQPLFVTGSVAVFLIYFCILREENAMDEELNKTLYDRLEGLEKQQLLQVYRSNKEKGLSVADIERRIKELDA